VDDMQAAMGVALRFAAPPVTLAVVAVALYNLSSDIDLLRCHWRCAFCITE